MEFVVNIFCCYGSRAILAEELFLTINAFSPFSKGNSGSMLARILMARGARSLAISPR